MLEPILIEVAPLIANCFFDRPQVQLEEIPIGPGIPFGLERVSNPVLGLGGAYGTWGKGYDNASLPAMVEELLQRDLMSEEHLNLAELGFVCRHHTPSLSPDQHLELEVKIGARLLVEAAHACGWEPAEVQAVLIGMTGPIAADYTERIAHEAGIPDTAFKVSIHKACDSSVAGLHLTLNSELAINQAQSINLARALYGKKVLVGGIEGLSRMVCASHDIHALQLFGNAAGVIGVIPGQNMRFLTGSVYEVYDTAGLLQVKMLYPYLRRQVAGQSMLEVTRTGEHHLRVAGLMPEPEDRTETVAMAGLMGMVKLFVRTGVLAVRDVYQAYQKRIVELGIPQKNLAVAIAHHANLKINQLLAKHLQKEGIQFPMPWLLSEFGNVSAASNMIAFLRKVANLQPGDHVLFDGFGAGTYYDVLAVELGES